ncbi:76949cae-91c1-4df7-bff6-0dfc3f9d00ab [Thermothielavioides terrestris]|uniref:DNA polymerase delta subunit 4 n=2 Tax=Thermothielavioides terrestris TaxID=2587410 RepID=G2RHE9_THETT|nr:uncharacterized protein THITE_2082804 [Thermothielavioides terrestris NRRL 8126]AEO71261.1 hypothetical protein THITE_2082804 [Thermothielavioides terrestris NRRL 8126]SPQ20374.1 76949cae-91c1-4df7-bff6-0dfc3f9d00ab [Thermothielavioides terrestris]
MPTTRRSSRPAVGAGKQSTLSFKHKVTKAIKTGKEGYKSPSRAKEYIPAPSPEPATTDEKPAPSPSSSDDSRLKQIEQQQLKQQQPPTAAAADEETDPDRRAAAQVTDAAIERYWAGIEAGRRARAVHRKHAEGLSTGEKVLRYFDVSSQYGPCIGISRIKRWQRAQRLGLKPPIEVLAVLLKEEAQGNAGIQRAHMDELLNSTAVGSVGV